MKTFKIGDKVCLSKEFIEGRRDFFNTYPLFEKDSIGIVTDMETYNFYIIPKVKFKHYHGLFSSRYLILSQPKGHYLTEIFK
jgi:hypothetical protein